jgi:hypothetical protein
LLLIRTGARFDRIARLADVCGSVRVVSFQSAAAGHQRRRGGF